MKVIAAIAALAFSACATTGDPLKDRSAAREARDAAQLLSVAGAVAVVAAPAAVLAAPPEQQGTAILVAAPIAGAGAVAYAIGGVAARAAIDGVE